MSDVYSHGEIEKKWQKKWREESIYKTQKIVGAEKRYILDMFPYPSGSTMHVGHLEGYVATDILARFYRMRGYTVFHPMGWDAFGLPAENYAIKTGIHPNISIRDNIKNFKRQLESSGLSYDWDYEIDTSDPKFYKWTQWIFVQLFKKGLAYKKKAPVNWCPEDETVLANEQVVDGKCERCDTPVVQKDLDQWFFKITDYADRLISGLNDIDWPESVKIQQRNWIGRSEGREIEFEVLGSKSLKVFTTRPDTLNSATFLAVASESNKNIDEKWGKFTGKYAINPLSGDKLPIWETNYVEGTYGTGAIMGVPAYDERDAEFAKKYHIDIVKKPFTKKILGERKVNYHLRDWLISRQRYWGCPIPMVYCEKCGWQPVDEKDLPVLLPEDVDFLPHGKSPIARSKSFQEGVRCSKCGGFARREVDTMDTYVDSSWYFIRFVDPKNKKSFADPEKIEKWLPVDEYVGGGHVVQHLLFARFFWKALVDMEYIDESLGEEPFLKLRAPGWILGSDSRKMSKRWNNVVTPDDVIPKFGADTLRVYEMFMGPFDVMKPWSVTGVEGASRFLNKVWRLYGKKAVQVDNGLVRNKTIKKVTKDIEDMHFNTAVAAIMEYTNYLITDGAGEEDLLTLVKLLAPFAPHMAEEIWQTKFVGNSTSEHQVSSPSGVARGRRPVEPRADVQNELRLNFKSIHREAWPEWDFRKIQDEIVEIGVQVNGKLRATLSVDSKMSGVEREVVKMAKNEPNVEKYVEGKKVKKTVFVPGKIVNFVV